MFESEFVELFVWHRVELKAIKFYPVYCLQEGLAEVSWCEKCNFGFLGAIVSEADISGVGFGV